MRQHIDEDSSESFFSRIRSKLTIHRYELLLSGVLLFVLLGFWAASNFQGGNDNVSGIAVSVTETATLIVVDVSGAVVDPGVYELHSGARIADAIEKSGGFNDESDTALVASSINLAQILVDGQKVYIPSLTEGNLSQTLLVRESFHQQQDNSLVSLNKATLEELESLPGIGPAFAQRIVENRPYSAIEQLLDVPGIGDKTYEKIKVKVVL